MLPEKNATVTVKRIAYGSNDGKYTNTVIASLRCYLQPRSDTLDTGYQLPTYKEYIFMCMGAQDIKENDQLTDNLSRIFIVKMVETYRDITGTRTKCILEYSS